MSSSGTAVFSLSNLPASSSPHVLSAHYEGDTDDAASISGQVQETVQQAATATALSYSPQPAIAGGTMVLTATVTDTSGAGTPGGSVSFSVNGTTVGSGTLNASGVATVNATLAPGTASLTATYGGDTDHSGSNRTLQASVQQATTTVTVSSSENPSILGDNVTFSILVQGQGATPGGKVTLLADGQTVSTAALSKGAATVATATLAVGQHAITASYSGDANDQASSTTKAYTQTVSKATPTETVSANPGSAVAGTSVMVTAVVKATGSNPTPTGTIVFTSGSASLGSVSLNATGSATLTTTALPAGENTIVASYSGDGNYQAVTASTEENTQRSTTATLASSANPSIAGASVIFEMQVSGAGAAPQGSITLMDGGIQLASLPLNASGGASFTTNGLAPGGHNLQARYSGDPANGATSSAVLQQQVQQATTNTALNASTSTLTAGKPLILIATVSGNGGTPSGKVQFLDNEQSLGAGMLNKGTASFTTTSLSPGSHNLTASYEGDTDDGTSASSPVPVAVTPATTALTLASSANPIIVTKALTYTARVTGNGGTPTRTVSFQQNGITFGSAALNASGVANVSVSSLPLGTDSIVAIYAGDVNDGGSEGALSEAVVQATPGVSVTSSQNPGRVGVAITLTAALAQTVGTPGGSISFTADGAVLGTAPVAANWTASLSVATLALGQHAILGSYSGDADNAAAQSAAMTETVQQTTGVTLSSSANPALATTAVQYTAQVSSQGGTSPTGTVTLLDGTTVLGTAPLSAGGAATFSLASLSAGTHALTASYGGDTADMPSVSPELAELVNGIATSVHLGASATALTTEQQLTLLASVNSSAQAPFPGIVTFLANGKILGTASAGGEGTATLTPSLAPGTYIVTATYGGDAFNAASTSAPLTITVTEGPDFVPSASSTSLQMASETNSTLTLNIQSVGGFSDQINLGCAALPYDVTCTFSKPSVMLAANGTQTVTVTIDTSAPLTAGGVAAKAARPTGIYYAGVLPGALWLLFAGRRRRRKAGCFVVALAAAMLAPVLLLSGCNGLKMTGASPGQYTIQITSTGLNSHITHNVDVTLDVTQ